MNFTLRQWAVIVALAAAFIGAAVVVSDPGEPRSRIEEAPPFDEVVWCAAANAVSRWSGVLDGDADGDTLDDVRNLRRALDDARPVAPAELGFEIARLQDFAMLVEQGAERDGSLTAGIANAEDNTDPERVAEAVRFVDGAITACGHPSIGG